MNEFLNSKKFLVITGVFLVILGLLALTIVMFLTPYSATEEYLERSYANQITEIIETDNWILIEPPNPSETDALIYYPGGLVSAESYIYRLNLLSMQTNQRVFIIKFPLALAVTDINKAKLVISENPDINNWTIAGHSLGGTMACRFTESNPEIIKNLILEASYCDVDLSNTEVELLAIYGSEDMILDKDTFTENRNFLGNSADVLEISGINHAQFGNYGEQQGDGISKIPTDLSTLLINTEEIDFILGL